ncbi:MAG: hypothetical protein WDZ27_02050 [Waddliaceae bacterium]
MTEFNGRLTQVNIDGYSATVHPEYTSEEVSQLFLEKLQPFLDILALKEEEIPGFLDANGIEITGPVPIVDQLARLFQDGLEADIEANLADLVDLAKNGHITGIGTNPKTDYLSAEMANALNQLFQSLESVGIQVDVAAGTVNTATITPDSLVGWKNLQGVSDIFVDIAKKLERAALTGPHSLQALVELVYIKTGNEVMADAMERLEEALALTKDALDTLTDVQTLHNQIDVNISEQPEGVDPIDLIYAPEIAKYIPGSAYYVIDSETIINETDPVEQQKIMLNFTTQFRLLGEKVRGGTATDAEVQAFQDFANNSLGYLGMISGIFHTGTPNPIPGFGDFPGLTVDPSEEMLEFFLTALANLGEVQVGGQVVLDFSGIAQTLPNGSDINDLGAFNITIGRTVAGNPEPSVTVPVIDLFSGGGQYEVLHPDMFVRSFDPSDPADMDFFISNQNSLLSALAPSGSLSGSGTGNFMDLQAIASVGYFTDEDETIIHYDGLPSLNLVGTAAFDQALRMGKNKGVEPINAFLDPIFNPTLGRVIPESPYSALSIEALLTGNYTDEEKEVILTHIQHQFTDLAQKSRTGTATSAEQTHYERLRNALAAYIYLGKVGMNQNPPDPNMPIFNEGDLFDGSINIDGSSSEFSLSPYLQDLITSNFDNNAGNRTDVNVFIGGGGGNPQRWDNSIDVIHSISFEDLQGVVAMSETANRTLFGGFTGSTPIPVYPSGGVTWFSVLDNFGVTSTNRTQFNQALRQGAQANFNNIMQKLESSFNKPINPTPKITADDIAAFERIRNEINEQITALESKTPTTPEGRVDQESLLAKLQVVQNDIENAFNTTSSTENALRVWISDRYNQTDSESAGLIQRNITNAIVAAESLNDSQKSEVRRFLYVFEEYYKSSAAILQKITQLIERIAQGISR